MSGIGRKTGRLTTWLFLCVLLSGCWDEVMIQDLHYITAMGLAYEPKSKQYELYAQIIDLAAVAKKEGDSEAKSNSVFGHARGASPSLALGGLFRTMQMEPNVDHVMAYVLDESTISRLGDVLDGITRDSSIRYTVNLLGTSNTIEELFKSTGKIALSPLNTNIYQPNSNKRSLPFTTRNDLRDMLRGFKSCPCTFYIPKLALEANHWEINSGSQLMLPSFDGAFVLNNGRYVGQFGEEQLQGARWFKGNNSGRFLSLKSKDQIAAVLNVKRSSADYRFAKSAAPRIKLKLGVQAVMTEFVEAMSDKEIEKLAAAEIKEQIDQTLQLARSKGIDLFGFEEHLYRYHTSVWKKMKKEKSAFEKLPVDIELKVHLVHSGKMKLKKS